MAHANIEHSPFRSRQHIRRLRIVRMQRNKGCADCTRHLIQEGDELISSVNSKY